MRIKIFIVIISAVSFLCACNKEGNFDYPEGTVGISKITNFPILTVNGEEYMAVPVGGTYTEPGVTAKEGESDLTVTTSGSVNTATVGVYTLTYSAVNKDGFSASAKRFVAVYSTDASAASHDLSGSYLRAATGVTNTWEKLAPGVYKVDNPGGAAGVNLVVFLFNPTGFIIDIPSQVSNDGNTTSSTDEVYNDTVPASYSMKIVNPGYGPALRTFVKQ